MKQIDNTAENQLKFNGNTDIHEQGGTSRSTYFKSGIESASFNKACEHSNQQS